MHNLESKKKPNKAFIVQTGIDLIDQKLNDLQIQLKDLNEALTNEVKSSAGDKYETSRAMIHQEQEKIHHQLSLLKEMKILLGKIEVSPSPVIQQGSLVSTDKGNYMISVGLGKVDTEEYSTYFISPVSPLAQVLLGKKAGESPSFNGNTFKIFTID